MAYVKGVLSATNKGAASLVNDLTCSRKYLDLHTAHIWLQSSFKSIHIPLETPSLKYLSAAMSLILKTIVLAAALVTASPVAPDAPDAGLQERSTKSFESPFPGGLAPVSLGSIADPAAELQKCSIDAYRACLANHGEHCKVHVYNNTDCKLGGVIIGLGEHLLDPPGTVDGVVAQIEARGGKGDCPKHWYV